MKALSIVALVFAGLSIFVPVMGIWLAILCSILALISFRSQTLLSGITFGVNIINVAFLTPSILIADAMSSSGALTSGTTSHAGFVYWSYLAIHITLFTIAIMMKLTQSGSTQKKIAIVIASLVIIVTMWGKIAPLRDPKNNTQSTTQNTSTELNQQTGNSSQKGAYVLTQREATLLNALLMDEVKTFASGGEVVLLDELPSVSSVEVSKTYESNQVAGDQQYNDKTFLLTGVIDNIGSGLGNEPYVGLRGINMFMQPQAHFRNPNVSKVANLKKGQTLRLVCEGGGAVVGVPMFQNCEFADEYAMAQIATIKTNINDFLSGDEPPRSDKLAAISVYAIAAARTLPDTSACFTGSVKCGDEIQALPDIKSTLHNVAAELKALGVQVPALKQFEAAPAANTTPVPQSNDTTTTLPATDATNPQTPPNAAVVKIISAAEECLINKKYDCAISKAEVALELEANNAQATHIKTEAKAAQQKAFMNSNWNAK